MQGWPRGESCLWGAGPALDWPLFCPDTPQVVAAGCRASCFLSQKRRGYNTGGWWCPDGCKGGDVSDIRVSEKSHRGRWQAESRLVLAPHAPHSRAAPAPAGTHPLGGGWPCPALSAWPCIPGQALGFPVSSDLVGLHFPLDLAHSSRGRRSVGHTSWWWPRCFLVLGH